MGVMLLVGFIICVLIFPKLLIRGFFFSIWLFKWVIVIGLILALWNMPQTYCKVGWTPVSLLMGKDMYENAKGQSMCKNGEYDPTSYIRPKPSTKYDTKY